MVYREFGSTSYVIRDNTNTKTPLSIETNSPTNSLYIKSTGYVGIGTASPGALLDLGTAGTTLGTMRLEGNTSGYLQLQPSAAAGSWTMTLPTGAGTSGQVLRTNGSGVTSWVNQSATAAGSDRQLQYNNSTALGGAANFTYDTAGSLQGYLNDTATAGSEYDLVNSYIDVAPSANQTSGRRAVALSGGSAVVAGNTRQIRLVTGVEGFAGNHGSGAVEALTGVSTYAQNNDNAAITTENGIYSTVDNTAGTITNANGADL